MSLVSITLVRSHTEMSKQSSIIPSTWRFHMHPIFSPHVLIPNHTISPFLFFVKMLHRFIYRLNRSSAASMASERMVPMELMMPLPAMSGGRRVDGALGDVNCQLQVVVEPTE